MMRWRGPGRSSASRRSCARCCAPAPMSLITGATCRHASWSRNMSTSPMPSSSARRPAWSMPCSTRSRASSAAPNSSGQGSAMAAGEPKSAEERLIAAYCRPLATHAGALKLTDDAALLQPPAGHDLVLTADALIGGVHFFPEDEADMVAKKALRVNLSDLAAKGAKPIGFLLTLALPKSVAEPWVELFARGLGNDAEIYECQLLGGGSFRS